MALLSYISSVASTQAASPGGTDNPAGREQSGCLGSRRAEPPTSHHLQVRKEIYLLESPLGRGRTQIGRDQHEAAMQGR